ncbi:MAG: hypothetical protein KGI04_02940 [Candidatus Micrarchaeota archaeon]|nr:hypothetical protein [Candidatus Micrarchaeota archaeon]
MEAEGKGKREVDAEVEAARKVWKEGIGALERRAKDLSDNHPSVVAYRELLAARARE